MTEELRVASPRCCGTRVGGGIYASVPLGEIGMPIEHFIFDPPQPLNPADIGLSPVGVRLVEQNGVWHIFDWVGSESYPHPTDILEEARQLGVSRRLPRTLEFDKLTAKSRLVLVHAHGYLKNAKDLFARREWVTSAAEDVHNPRAPGWVRPVHWFDRPNHVGPVTQNPHQWRCPKNGVAEWPHAPAAIAADAFLIADAHNGAPGEEPDLTMTFQEVDMCASLWWETVDRVGADGKVLLPCGTYEAAAAPGFRPEWQPALIARFPLAGIDVIRNSKDPKGEQRAFDAARRAGVPTHLKDS